MAAISAYCWRNQRYAKVTFKKTNSRYWSFTSFQAASRISQKRKARKGSENRQWSWLVYLKTYLKKVVGSIVRILAENDRADLCYTYPNAFLSNQEQQHGAVIHTRADSTLSHDILRNFLSIAHDRFVTPFDMAEVIETPRTLVQLAEITRILRNSPLPKNKGHLSISGKILMGKLHGKHASCICFTEIKS